MIYLIISALLWAVCGVLAFGYLYGYNQTEYPGIARRMEGTDFRFAIQTSWLGPFTLLAVLSSKFHEHGLKFRRTNRYPDYTND